jgi:hypothetical protein
MKSASMDETVLGHLADINWFGLAREAEANGMQAAVKMSADAYQSVHTGRGDKARVLPRGWLVVLKPTPRICTAYWQWILSILRRCCADGAITQKMAEQWPD